MTITQCLPQRLAGIHVTAILFSMGGLSMDQPRCKVNYCTHLLWLNFLMLIDACCYQRILQGPSSRLFERLYKFEVLQVHTSVCIVENVFLRYKSSLLPSLGLGFGQLYKFNKKYFGINILPLWSISCDSLSKIAKIAVL